MMNKKMFTSYLQSLLATALTAAFAINKSPLDFTNADFKIILNSIWVAFIPVIIRALSKSDTAFGVNGVEPVDNRIVDINLDQH